MTVILLPTPQGRAAAAALIPEVVVSEPEPPAVDPPQPPRWWVRAVLAVAANVAADVIVEVGRHVLDLIRGVRRIGPRSA